MLPILYANDARALRERVMNRSQLENDEISARVKEIVRRVREEGDAALFEYTERFDHAKLAADTVQVTREEIDAAYARFLEIYDRAYCVKTAPYDGILPLLEELTRRGYRLGIVTNKPQVQARKLSELFFADYPIGCVYGGSVPGRPHKPDPQVVRLALTDLNADPQTTLFVGDSDVDIHTGHNAGMVACGVTWGFRGVEELQKAGADILIDHPSELLQYL